MLQSHWGGLPSLDMLAIANGLQKGEPKMIVAAKPIEELLNRTLRALPVSVDDIILRGLVGEVTERIVELQRASLSLQEKYGSLAELEQRLQREGLSPDDHTLYTDLLEWRAIQAELSELQELKMRSGLWSPA